MAGWWTKLHALVLAGSLFSASFAQAQLAAPGLPAVPSVVAPQESTTAPPLAAPGTPIVPGVRPLPTDILLHPEMVQPPMPGYLAPAGHPMPLPSYQSPEKEPIAVTPAPAPQNCQGCSESKSRWTFMKCFEGKKCRTCDATGHQEGQGIYAGQSKHPLFRGHCYDSIDDFNTCTSLRTEIHFIFGSCRAFFGETCQKEPPFVPIPPGYSLPPSKRGW